MVPLILIEIKPLSLSVLIQFYSLLVGPSFLKILLRLYRVPLNVGDGFRLPQRHFQACFFVGIFRRFFVSISS